jgi:hypothetical protein
MCPSAHAEPAPAGFQSTIHPILEQYCFKCHAGEKVKGDVNLSTFADEQAILREPRLWRNVMDKLRQREMPPENKPQPTEIERQQIVTWVHATLSAAMTSVKDPGRVTIHRLNRAEYNNTIHDLLGVESHPADLFPADGAGGEGFDNNADTLFIPPILMEQYLKAADEVLREANPNRIFPRLDPATASSDVAKGIIERFASKAFRRPATEAEVAQYVGLFDRARSRGGSFEVATRLALKAILVSPKFLFRIEQDRDSKDPYPISDYELASRLSYFIWSSMPDDTLMRLAGEGQLHDPKVIEEQVRRMLADPKSRALADQFGTQWLQIRELKTTVRPDPRRFPEYTPALRDAMFEQAIEFVDSIFRGNKSLLTLIDADYAFVNSDLAKHYGLPPVKGSDLKKVPLEDGNRGGVLGLGAVLTVTSYPLRTSPVLRGKWVMEAMLGVPPAPPPPNAGKLPADDRQLTGLTFRQRLEEHRKRPECATCHNRLDPLGFGLENFDPIGRWRTTQADQPIDASGVLTTGEKFDGPSELKKALLAHKEDFIRNLTEKMLAYALGRGLEYYDQPIVQQIADDLSKNDYSSARLVIDIAQSYPFGNRRSE